MPDFKVTFARRSREKNRLGKIAKKELDTKDIKNAGVTEA